LRPNGLSSRYGSSPGSLASVWYARSDGWTLSVGVRGATRSPVMASHSRWQPGRSELPRAYASQALLVSTALDGRVWPAVPMPRGQPTWSRLERPTLAASVVGQPRRNSVQAQRPASKSIARDKCRSVSVHRYAIF
jgi:hypothetical protein